MELGLICFALFIPPPAGTALMQSLMQAAGTIGQKFLGGLSKSPEQKDAEYALSAQTNEIEKAMDINSMAFRAGFLTQAEALQNYDYLWNSLVDLAQRVSSITPAQAARTISDRDYGGTFANVWRGTFRDDRILGMNEAPDFSQWALDSSGYIKAEYRWEPTADVLKYGGDPSTIAVPNATPTPTQLAAGPGMSLASLSLGKVGAIAGIGYGLFRLLR